MRLFAVSLAAVIPLVVRAACPDATFEITQHYSVTAGTQPAVVSTTDVNLDGRSDVTFFYRDLSAFQTFLTTTTGLLLPGPLHRLNAAPDYSIGRSWIAIAHINSDGFPDAAGGGSSTLRVYSGNGSGSYALRTEIAFPARPTDVKVADLNADKLNDIVAVLASSAELVVVRQVAPWLFVVSQRLPIGGSEPGDPAIVDLDGDGRLDVVLANRSNTVDIFYGDVGGTFEPVTRIALAPVPGYGYVLPSVAVSLAVGDFNFDGHSDFAVGQIGHGAAIYLSDGGRQFHYETQLVPRTSPGVTGAGARDLELGDVNSDGLQDLVLSTYGGFYVALANQAGLFDEPVLHPFAPLGTGFNAYDGLWFEIGDSRGDGRADLFAAFPSASSSYAWTFRSACAPARSAVPVPTMPAIALATMVILLAVSAVVVLSG